MSDLSGLEADIRAYRKHGVGLSPVGANTAARAVLASDWLAAHVDRALAAERERIATAIEAEATALRNALPTSPINTAHRHQARGMEIAAAIARGNPHTEESP